MPRFKVRAQWWGPYAQVGVADDMVEADSACDALNFTLPSEWGKGEYMSAEIRIEPLPDDGPQVERKPG